MNSNSNLHAITESLDRLNQRICWKRWLGRLNRLTWVIAGLFLLLFLADLAFGMRTLGLRIASVGLLVFAVAMCLADWFLTWRVRVDRVGLAQLLETRYPDLAERLLTLVQMNPEEARTGFAPLLTAQTTPRLTSVDPRSVVSLVRMYQWWGATAVSLIVLFAGLSFVSAFGKFTYRVATSLVTPLVPYRFEVKPGTGYALHGEDVSIEATIHLLDKLAELPAECELVCDDGAGAVQRTAMTASGEKFVTRLQKVREPLRFHVEANGYSSESISIQLIDPPIFSVKPTVKITPPSYRKVQPAVRVLEHASAERNEVLRYSTMHIRLPLDRAPVKAHLLLTELADSDTKAKATFAIPVQWQDGVATGLADTIASHCGKFEARFALELEHGLRTTLAVGHWEVYDDLPPRFTEPLRLHGGAAVLRVQQEYRIAPDDVLKLQTAVEDAEGLGAITLEYRINDGPPQIKPWLFGNGRQELAIDDLLPLPSSLQNKDRVQFRIHVSDQRRLARGEIAAGNETLPEEDLLPQVVTAPSDADAWFTLLVDRTIGGFVKDQARTQADEVSELVGKIKKKVQGETADVQQLQRTIHQQTALMPAQVKQAEKLQKFNQEIMEDLNRAGERLLANPALAGLAGHFFDIAETEMQKAADALERFREKDRPLPEAEKELKLAEDALGQAQKKLERLLDWNKTIAEDRLDQWQIEKLEQRQRELAQRLERMQEQKSLSKEELEKEVEAIRNEQAKLAAETNQLQEKSRLVKDSLAALEQMRVQQLAQVAEKLAAEQEAMRELDPDKMPAEIKERLAKLAQRQAELARRAAPYAEKNQGPNVKPAVDAAVALKKPKLDEAIVLQKEHEKRQGDWLGKLLPGLAVNALRAQAAKLAMQQLTIRGDLDKLGRELAQLNDKMVEERLRDLLAKQKDVQSATTKLALDPGDTKLQELRKNAVDLVKLAGDQLAAKDALSAFDTMEKAQQQLKSLAAAMPQSLPVDRKQIKDAAERAKIEQVEQFEKEQKQLREETEKLLADWLKAAGHGSGPLKEKMAKLAGDLMELAQKGSSPEAKAMAKEAMQAVDDAKKAMEASQAMKAKGDTNEAKKMDDEAAKKMELAVKQLAKLVQEQSDKGMPKDGAEKTGEALKDSSEKMRQAEANLPKMPKDAQEAMQAAAKKLADAANQMSKQSAKSIPSPPGRSPSAKTPNKAGGPSSPFAKRAPLDASVGAAWGDLPGELKTRMLQDFRARYGEDYADMIRQYFDRLAENPRR